MFLKGSFYTAGYAAYNLQITGSVAYVVGTAGLQLVNISTISAPSLIKTISSSNPIYDVQVSGTTAYIASSGFDSGLQLIDFSSSAFIKGRYNANDDAYSVQVINNTAYLADGVSGLLILDISNAYAPSFKAQYNTTGYAFDIEIVGTTAYLIDNGGVNSGLHIVNLANPFAPYRIGTFSTVDAYDVQLIGTTAYIADGSAGLKIIDVSNASTPRLIGSYNTSGLAYAVQVVGNTAYIADGSSGLQVLDITKPSAPVVKGNYDTVNAQTVQLVDTNAFIADDVGGLKIISVIEFDNLISGSASADVLIGGAGSDTLEGSTGSDTASYSSATASVTANLSTPSSNKGDAAGDSYNSIENITGSAFADSLTGNSANNILTGGAGNDSLNGSSGNDTLNGGTGNDSYFIDNTKDVINETGSSATEIDGVSATVTWSLNANTEKLTLTGTAAINGTGNSLANTLLGNSASNVLNGGSGNDTLNGGAANDSLTGGTGRDLFQLTNATNSDRLSDFSVVDDSIQLENSVFTKLTLTGTVNSAYFKIATAATDSNDYIVYNSSTGALSYDADGTGSIKAVQIALLGSKLALTYADFIVS